MKLNKFFSVIIALPILGSAIYGYYRNIGAMKNDGAVGSMRGALAYVLTHWQEGDIMYTTDDGPWVNLTPYTDKPIYRMPTCQIWGSLSPQTREAFGAQVIDLDHLDYKRAWVFAPKYSPLHPECYTEAIVDLTEGAPVYVVDDGEWLYSGVWLVTPKSAAHGGPATRPGAGDK